MKRILYIGNNLKTKNANISSIQVLGGLMEREGLKVHYASSKANKVLRLLDMIYTVLLLCRRIDYVIIDTYSTHNFYFALIISQLCRILRIKYIPNLNGGNLPARLEKNNFLSRLIFNNSYLNVSPSHYLKDAFSRYGYENVRYIPNTIEITKYKFEIRSFERIKMLWVRSFSQIYNPEMAVHVLRKLIDLGFDSELCMVGPDSDGSLQKVKSLSKKLDVEVKLTGKLKKSEWIELAKDYNVFINTTNFDNTPVSVIEAMALGLPIVSTDVGGIPYLINDHLEGVLIEADNADSMVQAILNISFNKEFAENIAKNARRKVEQFDWEVVKHAWLEVLA